MVAGSLLPAQVDSVQAELQKMRQEVVMLQQDNLRGKAAEANHQPWEDGEEINTNEDV